MCNCDKPTGKQYPWRAANNSVAAVPTKPLDTERIPLRFTTDASIVMRGPATGTPYRFDGARATDVQRADATLMLSSGRFQDGS